MRKLPKAQLSDTGVGLLLRRIDNLQVWWFECACVQKKEQCGLSVAPLSVAMLKMLKIKQKRKNEYEAQVLQGRKRQAYQSAAVTNLM